MRKVELHALDIDLTSMIDVVFLLIVFFLLMPARKMEAELDVYLPKEGSGPSAQRKDEVTHYILLQARQMNEATLEIPLSLNQMPLGSFTSPSMRELRGLEGLSSKQLSKRIEEERQRDEEQFHPDKSEQIHKLLVKLDKATRGSTGKRESPLMIDADSKVPFKAVLAILNACRGAGYANIKFKRPGAAIWEN